MRKSWLTLILLGCFPVPLLAQHTNNYSAGNWATNHPSTRAMPPGTTPLPMAPNAPMATIPGYVGEPGNAPVAVLGTPVAAVPAPAKPSCTCEGCQREVPPIDWQCLRDWLCYRPMRGGCSKKGSCGCNCSVPLYTYFLGTCKEGQKYELPPCMAECDSKPGFFRQMWEDGRALFGSRRARRNCSASNCAGGSCGTGYQSLGMMAGK